MTELEQLIADQHRDLRWGDRVYGFSLDRLPHGADTPAPRARAHDDRHGTIYCYTGLRCRCEKCRRAIREHARNQRALGRWDTGYQRNLAARSQASV